MNTFIKTLKENKYEYISGVIALILIYFVVADTFSFYSYLIAGLWFGFWFGVKYIKRKIEKKFETSEDEKDFYEKIRDFIYKEEI